MQFIQIYVEGDDFALDDDYYKGGVNLVITNYYRTSLDSREPSCSHQLLTKNLPRR